MHPNKLVTQGRFSALVTRTPPHLVRGMRRRVARLALLRISFRSFREARASEADWRILANGLKLAAALAAGGSLNGVNGHLSSASAALQAIRARALHDGSWRPTMLEFAEIEALATYLDLHALQTRPAAPHKVRPLAINDAPANRRVHRTLPRAK